MPVPQPSLIVFDVNETLSDMSPLRARFEEVGLDGQEAATWFATLLRDGFALTLTGANPSFAALARDTLEVSLSGRVSDEALEDSVAAILGSLGKLGVHDDVVDGVAAMQAQGRRLVTLSNGGTALAEALFASAGVRSMFEKLLTVENAPRWKPAVEEAYRYALAACRVDVASEAMLVAVHPWDIEGARNAGLATAWINRSGTRYPVYFARPDLEATSVLDLARQLAVGSS